MHAEALVCALLTAMAIVIAFGCAGGRDRRCVVLGALAAALLLIKINVGAYAVISIGFAAVMAGPSLVRHAALRYAVILALVLVGPAVMASRLEHRVDAGLRVARRAVRRVARVRRHAGRQSGAEASDESARWPRWLIGGFVACLVVVLASRYSRWARAPAR